MIEINLAKLWVHLSDPTPLEQLFSSLSSSSMKPSRKKSAGTRKSLAKRSSRTSKNPHRSLVRLQQPGPSSQMLEEGDTSQLEEDYVSLGDDANVTASPVLTSFRGYVEGSRNRDDAEKLVASLTSSKLLYSPGQTLGADSDNEYEAASLETSQGIMRSKSTASKPVGNRKSNRKVVSCCPTNSTLLSISFIF